MVAAGASVSSENPLGLARPRLNRARPRNERVGKRRSRATVSQTQKGITDSGPVTAAFEGRGHLHPLSVSQDRRAAALFSPWL